MAYSKLHSSLVNSSLWTEQDHVRILFITLLALCDKDGCVYGSRPGLERAAMINPDSCDERNPWEVLLSPDPDSCDKMRAPEHEGRRIEEIPGGFRLLNFVYYRGLRNDDDRAEQNRIAQERHRNKVSHGKPPSAAVSHGKPPSAAVSHGKPPSAAVSHGKPPKAHTEAEADTEAETEKTKTVSAKADDLPVGFVSFWKEWPSHDRKVGKSNCLKIWKSRKLEPLAEEILKALERSVGSLDWTKDSGTFIPMPQTWLNQTPWESNGEAIQVGPKYADESRVQW